MLKEALGVTSKCFLEQVRLNCNYLNNDQEVYDQTISLIKELSCDHFIE